MNIGKTISALRRELGLSQAGLAEKLNAAGVEVTNQAICKWENGSTMPNARQFIALCTVLGIDDPLSEFTNGRFGVYAGLNDTGRRKLDDFRALLLESEKYRIKTAPRVVRQLPLYSLAVSAGTGQFLDGENYEMVEVGAEVPEGSNFGVRVAGDSMEPKYHDGQIIWVKQQRSLMSGDIGIFLYDGCAYLKQLATGNESVMLHSLNPEYDDIIVSPMLQLRVLGKVLN